MPLFLKDGKLLRVGAKLAASIDCCCVVECCEFSPAQVQMFFEDLDDAFESNPICAGNTAYSDVGSSNTNAWEGTVTDSWGCASRDMNFDITCADGVYTLKMRENDSIPWPGMDVGDGFAVTSTSVTCDPFTLVFEFTADVNAEEFCWTAKTGQHFRITVTEFP